MGITIGKNLESIQQFLNNPANASSSSNKYIYVTKNGTFKTQGPLGNFFTSKATKNNTINALKTLFADKQQEGLSKGNPFNCDYNDIFTANHGVTHTKLSQAFSRNSIMNYFNNSMDNLKTKDFYTALKRPSHFEMWDSQDSYYVNKSIQNVAAKIQDKIKEFIGESIKDGTINKNNAEMRINDMQDTFAQVIVLIGNKISQNPTYDVTAQDVFDEINMYHNKLCNCKEEDLSCNKDVAAERHNFQSEFLNTLRNINDDNFFQSIADEINNAYK